MRISDWSSDVCSSDLRLEHRPSQLSGGEQQRVAVARALANRPVLVLADEPTGNLDEHTADVVLTEFLRLVREHNSAALVATHNQRLAAQMDRAIRLHDGRLEERFISTSGLPAKAGIHEQGARKSSWADRKRVVEGKRVAERGDLGG